MRLRHLVAPFRAGEGKVIARFGGAALIKERGGRWRLQGGSRDDRLAAQEWISLFLHEAVVRKN